MEVIFEENAFVDIVRTFQFNWGLTSIHICKDISVLPFIYYYAPI